MTDVSKFDQSTYDSIKPYLKAVHEHMIETGRSTRDLVEFSLETFSDEVLPYLRRFLRDVHDGTIKIKNLTHSAKAAIFGSKLSPAQREERIRQAAYFRAEGRGFTGGSPEEDWRAAEKEVDAGLEREAGLFKRSRKSMSSLKTLAGHEVDQVANSINHWIETRGTSITATPAKKGAARKKAAVKKKVAKKKAAKKKAARKKAVKKKTSSTKKSASGETPAKEGGTKKKAATASKVKKIQAD